MSDYWEYRCTGPGSFVGHKVVSHVSPICLQCGWQTFYSHNRLQYFTYRFIIQEEPT